MPIMKRYFLPLLLVGWALGGMPPSGQADDDTAALAAREAQGTVAELLTEIEARDKALGQKDAAIRELQAAFDQIKAEFKKKAAAMQQSGPGPSVEPPAEPVMPDAEQLARVEQLTQERAAALTARDTARQARDASAAALAATQTELAAAQGELATLRAELVAARQALADLRATHEASQADIELRESELRAAIDAAKADRITLAYNIGCVYKASRMYQKAETEFLKALELAPGDPLIHFNLGVLYDDDLKNKEKARLHYSRFLEIAPDDPDASRVTTWLSELE